MGFHGGPGQGYGANPAAAFGGNGGGYGGGSSGFGGGNAWSNGGAHRDRRSMGGPTRLDIRLAKDISPSFQMPPFPAFLDAILNFSSVAQYWAVISSMLVQKVNGMQIKSK